MISTPSVLNLLWSLPAPAKLHFNPMLDMILLARFSATEDCDRKLSRSRRHSRFYVSSFRHGPRRRLGASGRASVASDSGSTYDFRRWSFGFRRWLFGSKQRLHSFRQKLSGFRQQKSCGSLVISPWLKSSSDSLASGSACSDSIDLDSCVQHK